MTSVGENGVAKIAALSAFYTPVKFLMLSFWQRSKNLGNEQRHHDDSNQSSCLFLNWKERRQIHSSKCISSAVGELQKQSILLELCNFMSCVLQLPNTQLWNAIGIVQLHVMCVSVAKHTVMKCKVLMAEVILARGQLGARQARAIGLAALRWGWQAANRLQSDDSDISQVGLTLTWSSYFWRWLSCLLCIKIPQIIDTWQIHWRRIARRERCRNFSGIFDVYVHVYVYVVY